MWKYLLAGGRWLLGALIGKSFQHVRETTSEALVEAVREITNSLSGLPEAERVRFLTTLRKNNATVHALVVRQLADLRCEAGLPAAATDAEVCCDVAVQSIEEVLAELPLAGERLQAAWQQAIDAAKSDAGYAGLFVADLTIPVAGSPYLAGVPTTTRAGGTYISADSLPPPDLSARDTSDFPAYRRKLYAEAMQTPQGRFVAARQAAAEALAKELSKPIHEVPELSRHVRYIDPAVVRHHTRPGRGRPAVRKQTPDKDSTP